jgi:hypothetical protein
MANYITTVNPYFQQISPQDQQGLMPVFQNIGAQQANQNAALQQQMQNNQAAGQAFQQGGASGLNPLAMAAMLRGKKDQFGNSGMSQGMTNGGVTGNIYDNNGNLLTTGNAAPPAATFNQAFGGFGGMGD